jgi:hypothetical protein
MLNFNFSIFKEKSKFVLVSKLVTREPLGNATRLLKIKESISVSVNLAINSAPSNLDVFKLVKLVQNLSVFSYVASPSGGACHNQSKNSLSSTVAQAATIIG